MWQSPNQRVRALAQAKKRERERSRRPFHIKRVLAELKISGAPATDPLITAVRLVLNDLTVKGTGVFCSHPLMVGSEVAVTMREPKMFYVKGRIVYCQEQDSESHILSSEPHAYRIGIQFVFASPDEERAVQAYLEELNRDYLHGSKAA